MLDLPHLPTKWHKVIYLTSWLWFEFILKEKFFGVKYVNLRTHQAYGKAIEW
jgi:hypothetical protein